jgi:drug/metabolite transporter (DMT)-like permease
VALLEVGGDALIRSGLQRRGVLPLLAGAATLVVYGFMVNLTKLDFSRLMGLYIVLFFLVAQAVAVLIFRESIDRAVMVGGGFIVLGGIIMTVFRSWRTTPSTHPCSES